MGVLEAESKKRVRRNQIKFLILGCAAVAGGIAIALAAPNVFSALGKLGIITKPRTAEYVGAARRRMKREGLLVERDGRLRLSPSGERELAKLSLALAKPARQKRWDGKWRILIFDIPEKRRRARQHIRVMLRSAGFERIQDSVWLYPFPCEEYVTLLKAEARIGKDLLYLIVDSLEADDRFRKRFELPPSHHASQPPVKLPALVETLLDPILPRTQSSCPIG